ncbi:hypothetical protein Tco_0310669, partial [Tanacetum coccineum]
DVAAYNPSAEVDYTFALQQLQNVNFPLLTKMKSNKDASIEAVMNILHLEKPLVDKLGLSELIHIQNIKENIANQRSVLHDVFVLLSKPFSAVVLTNTEGTSDIVPATADTTTALSKTFASASKIAPISVDDDEVLSIH